MQTEILSFWFGSDDPQHMPSSETQARWWKKDDAFDQLIRDLFEGDHMSAARGQLTSWRDTGTGALALVVLLDQLPRNMYRGTAHMHATDPQARAVVRHAIELQLDSQLGVLQRGMLYMPLMHSEDMRDHWVSQRCFDDLAKGATGEASSIAKQFVKSAKQHREIVFRWGRYPHRNRLLGRTSTADELAFLDQPGSSF